MAHVEIEIRIRQVGASTGDHGENNITQVTEHVTTEQYESTDDVRYAALEMQSVLTRLATTVATSFGNPHVELPPNFSFRNLAS